MKHADTLIIAVDPGKKGAVAIGHSGVITTCNYSTPVDMASYLVEHIGRYYLEYNSTKVVVYLESVHSSPQAGPKQSFSFGQNFGEWLGIFAALKVELHLVKPQEWQRMIPGRAGKSGSELKTVLKAQAQRLFPGHKVTLTNADALLIHNYATSL